jgi:hypothetical protein
MVDRSRVPESVRNAVCPTCGGRLQILDPGLRIGSTHNANRQWEIGVLLRCEEHGQWHWRDGGCFVRKVQRLEIAED